MHRSRMQADAISDDLWQRVSELVARTTGLHFPAERQADLQRGLTAAAAEFGFADSASCVDWLLSASLTRPQLNILASHLTIGETYFFRERKAFDALAEHVLPELIRRRRGRGQQLRLWSAACSTGEEPYSLAILVQQLLHDWRDWRVTILATDINENSLRKAAAGVYGEWSFRESPPGFKERYFERTPDGRFAVLPEIRNRVSFAHMNLAQDCFASLATDTNAMDVIFCRNVLIYFTPSHARKLVENLHHALLDGAWLVVSPSECSQTLSDMSEAKPRLEPLHEAKDVALSLARWIPPTAPSMADDEDLALAPSVLEAESRAFLAIKLPARRRLLQHHSAMHLVAQFLDFGVVSGHIHSSRLSAGARLSGRGLVFAPALPPNRETVGLQGRAERAGACDEPL